MVVAISIILFFVLVLWNLYKVVRLDSMIITYLNSIILGNVFYLSVRMVGWSPYNIPADGLIHMRRGGTKLDEDGEGPS